MKEKISAITDFECKDTLHITNEFDLQMEVVRYLRETKSHILFTGNGFSDTLDTPQKRLRCVSQGYQSGVPDLLIFLKNKRFVGLAVEFKTPLGTGNLSIEQQVFLDKLQEQGWFCLVTASFATFIETFVKYENNLL